MAGKKVSPGNDTPQLYEDSVSGCIQGHEDKIKEKDKRSVIGEVDADVQA